MTLQSSSDRSNLPCPCDHNDWDSVRIKKGNHSLRCRVCQKKWKVHHSFFTRCTRFANARCTKGAKCGLVHIHCFKEGLRARLEKFGDDILENVPAQVLDLHGLSCGSSEAPSDPSYETESDEHASAKIPACCGWSQATPFVLTPNACECSDVPTPSCDDENQGVVALTEKVCLSHSVE